MSTGYENIKFSKVCKEDMRELSVMHIDYETNGANKSFYKLLEFYKDKMEIFCLVEADSFIVASLNNEILGFIIFTSNLKEFILNCFKKNVVALYIENFLCGKYGFSFNIVFKTLLLVFSFPLLLFNYNKARVFSIVVKKGHRKKGIGTMLIRETINRLKEKGVVNVDVTTSQKNVTARSFYAKNSFYEVGSTLESIGSAILLRRDL